MAEALSKVVDDEPLELPVEKFLTYRLLVLTNRLNRQAVKILDEAAQLRLPEWRCLAFIRQCAKETGRAGLHEIAAVTEMDRALISRSVQGLAEKGHVLTERDGTDRRAVYVRLTKRGEQTYDKTIPLMRRRQLHLLGALSEKDRKAIYRIIDHLGKAVDTWEQE